MRIKTVSYGIGLALALAATPALARHNHRMEYPAYPYPATYAPPIQAAFPVDRALAERCGLRAGSLRPHLLPAGYHDGYGRRRDGLGGALLGGGIGGLLGNRIAGRGDRLLGTAAGAAVGAILLANGTIREKGKFSPENLDPRRSEERSCRERVYSSV